MKNRDLPVFYISFFDTWESGVCGKQHLPSFPEFGEQATSRHINGRRHPPTLIAFMKKISEEVMPG